jgi:hypothetical protein
VGGLKTNKQVNRILRCQRCFHVWTYGGKNPYFTLCPRCRTTISTRKIASQSAQVGDQVQTAKAPAGTALKEDDEYT